MKSLLRPLLTAASVALGLATHADVLELRNGQIVNGKYLGGTAATLRFETSAGVQVFETQQVMALTFSGGQAATPAAGAPAAAAVAAPPAPTAATAASPATTPGSGAPVTLPAGTVLLVRLVDGVSSSDPKGKRFTTALEVDLAAGGAVAAPAGTKVYGRVESAQQARRYAGQSTLDVRLTELAIGGNLVPIATGPYAQAGSKSMGKTARGAAAGAAIGAIADGGEGAGKGAAIGAVASGLKRGESVSLRPGTVLEFQLQQALTLTPVR